MAITVEVVYENGVLKPLQPLPLAEHAKVSVTVEEKTSWTDKTYGMVPWTGTAEELDKLLEEAEYDLLEGK